MSTQSNQARAIFLEAIERSSPEQRADFIASACGDDLELRERVERLLRSHELLGSFHDDAPPTDVTIDQPLLERPGTQIGPYKLLQEIGEGGMGVVYMAEQKEPVERRVALKIIKPGMDTRQVIARFEAERQAVAMMDHPNIAKVLDAGATDSGLPYFVMELVTGQPITEYCDAHHLTPRERLELFVQVCHGVQHAHQKGIIHRDIKPTNVLVAEYDDRPVPKIIDFGVAKAINQRLTERTVFTQVGQVVGTVDYMSPEQAKLNQLDIDTRTDIYSLGVLLYELLTGETPFDRERLRAAAFDELLRIIREEEPPKPSLRLSSSHSLPSIAANRQLEPKKLSTLVRGELDWIVMKALEKDRNCRYATANGFAADIECHLRDEPVLACPPSVVYRLRKFARRHKGHLVVGGLALLLIILLGGGGGWVLRDRAAQREEAAQHARESLSLARKWLGENKLALARQELAAAKRRVAGDRDALGGLVDEVEAFEAAVGQLERFLDLVEQAHEAEFSLPMLSILLGDSTGGTVILPQTTGWLREPAEAAPFLLQALSCYGVLERDDWSARLEAGFLEPDQVARVRRTVYEELLWLADDVARLEVDHRSGRKVSPPEAAQEGLAYLRQAEAAGGPTRAFYQTRARLLNALGKHAEARQDEELARRTPPMLALDHNLLAGAAYDARNYSEAVKQCEAAIRVEPTHYWSLLGLGESLNYLGRQEQDFALAVAFLTGCILQRPDHARPYVGRAYAYQQLRRPKEAEAECRQALRLRPDYPEAHNYLAVTLVAQRRYAEAEAESREALRLVPGYAEAHDGLGVNLLAQRRYAEAEAECREALRLQPDLPSAHCNLGAVLEEGQGKHAEAEAEFRESLRLQPDLPYAHSNLGNILENQGKYAEAEAECREALRLQPDYPDAHAILGVVLHKQGKCAEAEAELREALRLRPDFLEAHVNLSVALYAQGKDAEAEAELREALRLRPDFPEAENARCNLGRALHDQGEYAGAEAEYREALRLRPDFPEAHYALGNLLIGQGKHAEAEAEYREALRLRPDYPEAHTNLGNALGEQGRHAEAEAEYREALRLRPDFPEADIAHYNLGNLLIGQGKHAEAEAEYREALRLRPEYPKACFCLGLVLREQRGPAAAARFYADTFAARPKVADDLSSANRYNAACAAALAGCGQGRDAATVDDAERSRLRRQALDWLRADLGAWGQLLQKQPETAGAPVPPELQQWQQDADFAGVRGDALAKLPDAERQAWQQLWADVEQTLKGLNQQDAQEAKKEPAN